MYPSAPMCSTVSHPKSPLAYFLRPCSNPRSAAVRTPRTRHGHATQQPAAPAPAAPPVRVEVRHGAAPPVGLDVAGDEFVVGSVPGCDLRIPGANLPPQVCAIRRGPDGVRLRKIAQALPDPAQRQPAVAGRPGRAPARGCDLHRRRGPARFDRVQRPRAGPAVVPRPRGPEAGGRSSEEWARKHRDWKPGPVGWRSRPASWRPTGSCGTSAGRRWSGRSGPPGTSWRPPPQAGRGRRGPGRIAGQGRARGGRRVPGPPRGAGADAARRPRGGRPAPGAEATIRGATPERGPADPASWSGGSGRSPTASGWFRPRRPN